MDVSVASMDHLDALVDCWVALAREQREHGSRLLAEANRGAVRQTLSEAVAAGDVLVAAGSPSESTDRVDAGGADAGGADVGPADAGGVVDRGADAGEADAGVAADRGADPGEGGTSVGDELLGFANVSVPPTQFALDDVRGVVHNLYVRPPVRDRGVGSALLAAAEAHLAEAGADAVSLEAMADNEAARRFYRRHGYEPHRCEFERALGSDTH